MNRLRSKIAFAAILLQLSVVVQSTTEAQIASGAWRLPRTVDGQPDLQGAWANNTVTPIERVCNTRR